MPTVISSGNPQFDAAAQAAETIRQGESPSVNQAVADAVTSQAVADVVTIDYLRTVVAAGQTYNVLTINEQALLQDLLHRKYIPQFVADPDLSAGRLELRQDGSRALRQDDGRELRQ